jgi:hypothetical protein
LRGHRQRGQRGQRGQCIQGDVSPSSRYDPTEALIAALADVPDELYLMLDGAECLRDTGAWAVLQALIDARLPRLHLALATRAVRPCVLASLGRRAWWSNLDDESLAFTLAEIRACLPPESGQAASVRLLEATRGWPAGVRMLAGGARPTISRAALDAYWTEVVAPGLSAGQAAAALARMARPLDAGTCRRDHRCASRRRMRAESGRAGDLHRPSPGARWLVHAPSAVCRLAAMVDAAWRCRPAGAAPASRRRMAAGR